MKKSVLTVLCLFPALLFAQNGVTTVPIPSTLTTSPKNVLAVDNSNNVWIGFSNKGLAKYDGTTWTVYNTLNMSLLSDNVQSIAFAGADVWVGTYRGASVLSGSTWTTYGTGNSGIASDTVYSVAVHGSDVWFGTHRGLSKFNGTSWTTYTTVNSGLPHNRVQSVAVDAAGDVWIGTYAGFVHYNGAAWTVYNTSNSILTSNTVRQVFIDNAGFVWAGCGLSSNLQRDFRFNGTNFQVLGEICYPQRPNATDICGTGTIGTGPYGFPQLNMFIVASWSSPGGHLEASTPVRYLNPQQPIFFTARAANASLMWFTSSGNFKDLYLLDPLQHGALGITTPDNIRTLDANEVNTSLMNRGDMSWDLNTAQYEVPKGGSAHSVFASAFWLGGLDAGGSLHQAAMTYRQSGSDYWPGPLDTTNGTTDTMTAAQYDRIWKIEKVKILEFQYYWSTGDVQNGNYIPDNDILTWPAHGTGNHMRKMAPFVDVNGNGIYDPLTGGDYPDIKGDQMLYWIFNDNLSAHEESDAPSLKVEVHASAYAFYCPSLPDSTHVLNYTTYYHFDIYNWSGQQYHDVHVGLFQDADLGYYADDFVGCYPPANIAFAYNGYQNDGGNAVPSLGTYGAHPPISTMVLLKGPFAVPGDSIDNDNDGTVDEIGERNLLTGFVYYNNDFSVTGNPAQADDYYGYCTGHWKDSTVMTYGGNGYGGVTPTRFMFPDLPYTGTGWSEPTTGNTPFDRRFVASCGPFNLQNGQPQAIDYAIMFTRDTTVGAYDSAHFALVLRDAALVKDWFAMQSEPSCVQWMVGVDEPVANNATAFTLFPNPASTTLTIAYEPKAKDATYEVIDLTGRVLLSGTLSQNGQTVLNVEDFATGIYLVHVIDGSGSGAVKFIRE